MAHEDLAEGIHHIDAAGRAYLSLPRILVPELEIQIDLGTVNIPQSVTAAGHNSPVLTQEEVVRPLGTLLNCIPLRLDVRSLKEFQ